MLSSFIFEQRQKGELSCLMFANPLMSLTSITSLWFVVKLDLHCHFSIFFPSEAHICRERPIICTKLHLCSSENEFSTLPIVFQLLFSFCLDFMVLHGRMHVFFSLLSNHRFVTSQGNAAICKLVWASLFLFCFVFEAGVLIVSLFSFFIFYWHVCYTCIVTDQCNWNMTNQ